MNAVGRLKSKSTIGRPRVLTDAQVAEILSWHDALLTWKAQRAALKTIRQLAKELGVTHGAITSVIRRGLKQACPEIRKGFADELGRTERAPVM
jgi:hypothetical protein